MAQKQKPRLAAFLSLPNELQRILVEDIRRVELFGGRVDFLFATAGQSDVIFRIVLVVRMTSGVAVKFVKTSLDRPGLRMHVPLAHVVAAVSGRFQHFGDRHAALIQSPKVAWPARVRSARSS